MLVTKKDSSVYRSLAQIFTPSNFNKIVRKGDITFTKNRAKKYIQTDFKTNSHFIKSLYQELETNYRGEYFYKNAILNKLILKKYSLDNVTILNEFKIGTSIADYILLNGEVKIFEIKTELDSLDKLDKQISDYFKFANKVVVVASSKFSEKLLQKYSNSPIGIIEFSDDQSFKTLKDPINYLKDFNHTTLFNTLRKQEYLDIIQDYFGFLPSVPNTLIYKECLALVKTIDIVDFQKLCFQKLKLRNIRCKEIFISDSIPDELKHICYTLDFSKSEYKSLEKFLTKQI